VHRRTLARSLTLLTYQVAEGFALPAATASSSLRFTAPLLAAEHFRLLVLRRGTACHRRLRRHRLWRLSALDSRRFCSLRSYPEIRLIWHFLCLHIVYSEPTSFLNTQTQSSCAAARRARGKKTPRSSFQLSRSDFNVIWVI